MKATKTIKLFFPGRRYSVDRSLLYFLDKYIEGESIYFKYDSPRGEQSLESLENLEKEAYEFVLNKIKDIDLSSYDEVIFISKSLGTYIASKLRENLKLKCTKFIALTPIEETIPFLKQTDFIVTSLNDKYLDVSALKEKENRFPFLTILHDLPHSLEYEYNLKKTFEVQAYLIDLALNYLDTSYKDFVE